MVSSVAENWTMWTMPQPCSSRRLVLTLERATERVVGNFLGVQRAAAK